MSHVNDLEQTTGEIASVIDLVKSELRLIVESFRSDDLHEWPGKKLLELADELEAVD